MYSIHAHAVTVRALSCQTLCSYLFFLHFSRKGAKEHPVAGRDAGPNQASAGVRPWCLIPTLEKVSVSIQCSVLLSSTASIQEIKVVS